jgi:hypothetical protein
MKARRLAVAFAFIGIGIALTLAFFRLWIAAYPDAGDPRNLSYVLWEHGLNSDMDLDAALATMTHEPNAKRRVIGLSQSDLQARFGYTKTYEQVTPYLKLCATIRNGEHGSRDVLYLRGDWWMATMKDDRADDLVLCKGY